LIFSSNSSRSMRLTWDMAAGCGGVRRGTVCGAISRLCGDRNSWGLGVRQEMVCAALRVCDEVVTPEELQREQRRRDEAFPVVLRGGRPVGGGGNDNRTGSSGRPTGNKAAINGTTAEEDLIPSMDP
jgi:hypothetical protein